MVAGIVARGERKTEGPKAKWRGVDLRDVVCRRKGEERWNRSLEGKNK